MSEGVFYNITISRLSVFFYKKLWHDGKIANGIKLNVGQLDILTYALTERQT
jgi:hypothetical protein